MPRGPAPYSHRGGILVKQTDHSGLLGELAAEYAQHSPRSAALQQRALRVLVDGAATACG